MKNNKVILFAIVFISIGNISDAQIKGHVALLIGNSDYRFPKGELATSQLDIDTLEEVLTTCGFEVQKVQNGKKVDLTNAIIKFSKKLNKNKVGLLFFGGHGVRHDSLNYILPIDASISDLGRAIDSVAISTNWIQDQLSLYYHKNRKLLIFFDNCNADMFDDFGTTRWTSKGITNPNYIASFTSSQEDGITSNSKLCKYLLQKLSSGYYLMAKDYFEIQKDISNINFEPNLDYSNLPDTINLCKSLKESGGEIDTDFDGIQDSFDKCPDEPGPQQTNGCIYYFEGFDNNMDEWDVGDSPLVPASINDGKYVIEYTGTGWWARWNTDFLLEVDPKRNFEIETRIKGQFKESSSEFGVRWSISPTKTLPNGTIYNNSIMLFLKQSKQLYIRKYLYEENKYIPTRNRTSFYTTDIHDFQKIRIVKVDDFMLVYINDVFTTKFIFKEPMIRDFGFLMRGKTKVEVDYLKVNYID